MLLNTRRSPSSVLRSQASTFSPPRKASGFTLIELLVVIAIIAILAALGFAGVNGALKSARKAEVRAMANQIKLAISSYYAEYGVFPPGVTNTDTVFLRTMAPTNSLPENRRGIRFLEVPDKFTNSAGIVTPANFLSDKTRTNFTIKVDTNYDGRLTVSGVFTNMSGSVAVWAPDPDDNKKVIGTW
jgi:prepilin-type N-terminal cleavage/methylation domain-containing protein